MSTPDPTAVTSTTVRTVRTPLLPASTRPTLPRLVAAVIWCGGVTTTSQFLGPLLHLNGWTALLSVSLGAQIVLSIMQARIWQDRLAARGRATRSARLVQKSARGVDTVINAGGLFVPFTRIGETPTAQMFTQAFGLAPQIGAFVAFLLALLFGYLIAVSPEEMWSWD